MTQTAHQSSAALHAYQHLAQAARPVVLHNTRDDRRHLVRGRAARRRDLRVTGRYTRPGVSELFGEAITCYDG
jgi:hypothetical protein